MSIKNALKKVLWAFHLDLTKNIKYDRLTQAIIKRELSDTSNCIDVGCHKGEILDLFLKYASAGDHFAFEPIPYLYEELRKKYSTAASVFPHALSEIYGETTFQHVKNAPAYSGIKRRKYDIKEPEIEEISVQVETLDRVLPRDKRVDFMKIDVEGGEYKVLLGARDILTAHKPSLLFEFGKGASDYYGTTPAEIFNFLNEVGGYKIYTLQSFLNKAASLTIAEFENLYHTKKEYYFFAKN